MSFRTCSFALLVKTGSVQHHDGYNEVLVGSGNGFVYVAPYGFYNLGSIVVDKCFPDIINVQVRTKCVGWEVRATLYLCSLLS